MITNQRDTIVRLSPKYSALEVLFRLLSCKVILNIAVDLLNISRIKINYIINVIGKNSHCVLGGYELSAVITANGYVPARVGPPTPHMRPGQMSVIA